MMIMKMEITFTDRKGKTFFIDFQIFIYTIPGRNARYSPRGMQMEKIMFWDMDFNVPQIEKALSDANLMYRNQYLLVAAHKDEGSAAGWTLVYKFTDTSFKVFRVIQIERHILVHNMYIPIEVMQEALEEDKKYAMKW